MSFHTRGLRAAHRGVAAEVGRHLLHDHAVCIVAELGTHRLPFPFGALAFVIFSQSGFQFAQGKDFNTGWGNASIPNNICSINLLPGGRAFLDGVAIRSSGSSSTIATLPTGTRPRFNTPFPVIMGDGSLGRVVINASGEIVLVNGSATLTVSLNGLNWNYVA